MSRPIIYVCRLIAIIPLLLFGTAALDAQGVTAAPPLSSYDWAVRASPNLASNPPPMAAIRAFMAKVKGRDDDWQSNVCEFRFADLRRTGNLSLIVTLNDGGHGGCGSAYIIDRTPSGYEARMGASTTNDGDEIGDVVQGPAGDGKLYLVFYDQFTEYQGAFCAASWPVIYGWDGNDYANISASRQFRPFYKKQIKALKKVEEDGYRNNPRFDPLCEQAEIDKIARFLGAPADTGMIDAIRWANSSDPVRRVFSVGVLSDLGTPEALGYLHILANDSDRGVAMSAQMELASTARNGRPAPSATCDFIDDERRLQMPWWLVLPPHRSINVTDEKWDAHGGYLSKALCEAQVAELASHSKPDDLLAHAQCIPAPTF